MVNFNNQFLKMQNLFFLLALLFSLPAFAQRFDYPIKEIEPAELVVTYSLKYQQDSTNPYFIKQEDMLLFIGKNISKFTSKNNYVFDTIMRGIHNHAEFQQLLSDPNRNFMTKSRFLYQIFKNYPKGKITCFDHVIGGSFKYEENLNMFHWQLSSDTTTICGYKAQKATCKFGGRNWIAWFTSEIPYSDGPYKFNGLPGLIVKVRDTRNHYVFELESIEKPKHKTMIDYREKDFIETTKQGFFRAKDAFRNDIVSRARQAGLSSKEQQTAARNMAQRNNPLELKRK